MARSDARPLGSCCSARRRGAGGRGRRAGRHPGPGHLRRPDHGRRAAVPAPALSLAEDRDLDIADELRERALARVPRGELPRQTEPRADGSELSPHDPLLPCCWRCRWASAAGSRPRSRSPCSPALLAALLSGWRSAASRVRPAVAAGIVVAFGLRAAARRVRHAGVPRAARRAGGHGRGRRAHRPLGRRGRMASLGLAVVALPWLAVKYAPVAAALVAVALVGWWRAATAGPAVVLAARSGRRGRRLPRRAPGWSTAAGPSTPPATTSSAASSRSIGDVPRLPAGRCGWSACSSTAASAWRPGRRCSCSPSPRSPRSSRRRPPGWAGAGRCRSPPGGPTPPSSRSPCTAGGGPAARSSSSCRAWCSPPPGGSAPGHRRRCTPRARRLAARRRRRAVGVAGGRGAAGAAAADHRLRGDPRPALPGVARAAARLRAPHAPRPGAAPGPSGWRSLAGRLAPAAGWRLRPAVTRMRALANEPMPTWRPSISTVMVPSGDDAVTVPAWPGTRRPPRGTRAGRGRTRAPRGCG